VEGEALEDVLGGRSLAHRHAYECIGDRRFHRILTQRINPGAACRQPQHRPPSIARVVVALEKPLRDQSLDHTGEGTRVDVQDSGQIASRQTRKETDHAEHEPLGAGDTHRAAHALRHASEPVHDCPQESHELQDVRQSLSCDSP
jgi:hypothetical protein